MNFAIIAAGEGSRLASEGIKDPKPLVQINGEALIDRLIRIFMDNHAESISIICNDLTHRVSAHLEHIKEYGLNDREVPLNYMVKTTPSSMHSLWHLSKLMPQGPFVLTTVDTIFSEQQFARYIEAFQQSLAKGYDALMGVRLMWTTRSRSTWAPTLSSTSPATTTPKPTRPASISRLASMRSRPTHSPC